MPFDMTPTIEKPDATTVYGRLCILRELLPKSGNQNSYRTCLWSEARRDKRLRAVGVSCCYSPTQNDAELFGPWGERFFDGNPKETKAAILDIAIEQEKARAP